MSVVLETNAADAGSAPMPNGQALAVATASSAQQLKQGLAQVGYACQVVNDPYSAALELLRRPLAFRALVLSLLAVYPEELSLIELVRRRFRHLEVIVADTHGRERSEAEAIRLGADAVLDDQRLHRVARAAANGPPIEGGSRAAVPATATPGSILSAEEIKALMDS